MGVIMQTLDQKENKKNQSLSQQPQKSAPQSQISVVQQSPVDQIKPSLYEAG